MAFAIKEYFCDKVRKYICPWFNVQYKPHPLLALYQITDIEMEYMVCWIDTDNDVSKYL